MIGSQRLEHPTSSSGNDIKLIGKYFFPFIYRPVDCRIHKLSWDPYFFNTSIPPFRFDKLLFRKIANAIDDTEIKAAVRKIRLYDSGDGNEAEISSISDSTNTWFACRYIPAITGPTEDPIR